MSDRPRGGLPVRENEPVESARVRRAVWKPNRMSSTHDAGNKAPVRPEAQSTNCRLVEATDSRRQPEYPRVSMSSVGESDAHTRFNRGFARRYVNVEGVPAIASLMPKWGRHPWRSNGGGRAP